MFFLVFYTFKEKCMVIVDRQTINEIILLSLAFSNCYLTKYDFIGLQRNRSTIVVKNIKHDCRS